MNILKIAAALLLTAAPALAESYQQSASVSNMGTVGRMVGGNVSVTGVGSASVNVPGGNYSFTANGNSAPTITAPTGNVSAKINATAKSSARATGFTNTGVMKSTTVQTPGFQAPSIPALNSNFGSGFSLGLNSGLFTK